MKKAMDFVLSLALVQVAVCCGIWQARAQSAPYSKMAPPSQYLIADQNSEIVLARSAASKSISDSAEVLVLGSTGYTTAAKGSNGFVCLVERSFGAAADDPEFWNSKIRSPICMNPAAARTYLPIILMKARLALAGKSKTEIGRKIASALDTKELPSLEAGAMCYMTSKEQYLSDSGKHWHPHVMFFIPGDAAKSWGGNLPGSPVIAANDPDERMTIFLVWVGNWSDGTPAPHGMH